MGELSDARKNIDQLDNQLLTLLAQRRALAERVIRISTRITPHSETNSERVRSYARES